MDSWIWIKGFSSGAVQVQLRAVSFVRRPTCDSGVSIQFNTHIYPYVPHAHTYAYSHLDSEPVRTRHAFRPDFYIAIWILGSIIFCGIIDPHPSIPSIHSRIYITIILPLVLTLSGAFSCSKGEAKEDHQQGMEIEGRSSP